MGLFLLVVLRGCLVLTLRASPVPQAHLDLPVHGVIKVTLVAAVIPVLEVFPALEAHPVHQAWTANKVPRVTKVLEVTPYEDLLVQEDPKVWTEIQATAFRVEMVNQVKQVLEDRKASRVQPEEEGCLDFVIRRIVRGQMLIMQSYWSIWKAIGLRKG